MKYKLACGATAAALTDDVNASLAMGWEICGNAITLGSWFYQPMQNKQMRAMDHTAIYNNTTNPNAPHVFQKLFPGSLGDTGHCQLCGLYEAAAVHATKEMLGRGG